ncbi:MAG TPA: zinc ribbon domain-containing protein [Gemmatimonadaceae bacterium]|nr:zinc ribbon domain-containing protein [Gemmatimonadaceae bacterium]
MTVPPSGATPPAPNASACPSCGAAATGHFCASCGSPMAGARCASCATILTPGSKFCHRCGTAAGASALGRADATSTTLPWAIAGIALIALVGLLAGQRFRSTPPADAAQAQAQAQGSPQGDPDGGAAPDAAAPGVRAPDISSMTPRERADRLFDRIMRLDTEGKKDSVQFFAPMAIAAYQMIQNPDADARFDMGRIAEVAGAFPAAKSEADSILAKQPTHLLGLVLAMQAARSSGDTAGAIGYRARLRAAQRAELAKKLPEYDRHIADIRDALASGK